MLNVTGTMVSLGNSYQSQLMLAVQIIPFILAGKTGPRPNFLVGAVMFLTDTTGPFLLLWSVTLSYGKTGNKNVQLVLQVAANSSKSDVAGFTTHVKTCLATNQILRFRLLQCA